MGDIMEADEVEVAVSALPSGDSGVSARGKSKAKALLRVLESGWVS
ncbi:U-box domain-containing protein [Musa troglodytarum]|nr:U-box domain-containing protein [Musa troglodytarum]